MKNAFTPVAFLAACAFTYAAQAEEITTKTETVRENGAVVKSKEEVKVEDKSQRGGNWFTNFWVHDVGGTIGNGLKKGAHKIDRGFNNAFGKGDDEPKTVTKTETKTEVRAVETPAPAVRTETKTETRTTEPAPLPKP